VSTLQEYCIHGTGGSRSCEYSAYLATRLVVPTLLTRCNHACLSVRFGPTSLR